MEIAGLPMGCILSTKAKPGLAFNRFIKGCVIGTSNIKKVEIFRNGSLFQKFEPNQDQFDFEVNDPSPLEAHLIKSKLDDSQFLYYYIRAVQDDGHVAWGSPIWIEMVSQESVVPIKPAKKNSKI